MPASENISPELKPYVALVDFLGITLGSNTEIVLQDCRDFEHSIVAIANGHVSGRTVGGPATDLILRVWHDREYDQRDYITKYTGTTADGHRLVSSTFFIRNANGEAIGSLCINHDASALVDATRALDDATQALKRVFDYLAPAMPDDSSPMNRNSRGAGQPSACECDQNLSDATPRCAMRPIENFSVNADDLTADRIAAFCANTGVTPERMSREERLALIRELDDAGVFSLKGAVDTVSERLGVSQPSVYRYLKQVRESAN